MPWKRARCGYPAFAAIPRAHGGNHVAHSVDEVQKCAFRLGPRLPLERFLYFVPNYEEMALVSKYIRKGKLQVDFGLATDFRD